MSQANEEKYPDSFFEVENMLYCSYRFTDKNGKPIPNELGYRAIKYIKTSCVQNGRAVIPHSDVNHILVEYTREDLAAMLEANGEPWIPFVPKKGSAKQGDDA